MRIAISLHCTIFLRYNISLSFPDKFNYRLLHGSTAIPAM